MARAAVITGGSGIIGLAIAEKFLLEGIRVAIVGSNLSSLEKCTGLIEQYGELCTFWVCELHNLNEIKSVMHEINNKIGPISILVNCAGKLETKSPDTLSEDIWNQVMDVNLKSYFFTIQSCLTFLKQSEHPRIINISSNAGRMGGYANGAAYAASKGGVISMTYNLARNLAQFGITVNCVAPGTIDSEMIQEISVEKKHSLIERFPVSRFGKPNEVATAVYYFAKEESAFTTGAVLDVNGGLYMG